MLYNFEKNGGNLQRAIDVELVKKKCIHLAQMHRRKSLLSKGLCALIKEVINNRREDHNNSFMMNSFTSGTTLNRMLKGVVADTHETQLSEFIQFEKQVDNNELTLYSEPSFKSQEKAQNMIEVHTSTMSNARSGDTKRNQTAVFAQLKSPSVNDLSQSF